MSNLEIVGVRGKAELVINSRQSGLKRLYLNRKHVPLVPNGAPLVTMWRCKKAEEHISDQTTKVVEDFIPENPLTLTFLFIRFI